MVWDIQTKFKLFIFLLTNNCYKVALCTPLHAWHGHVAPRQLNNQIFGYSGDPNNRITEYSVIRVTRKTE